MSFCFAAMDEFEMVLLLTDFVLDYQQQVKRLVMGRFKEEENEAAAAAARRNDVRDDGSALIREVSASA